MSDKGRMTINEAQQAARWVDVLVRVLGCAGEPACDDAEGGENRCTACEARMFLDKLDDRKRRWRLR